ncbi:MAG: sulfatase family protein [Actinomycetota bacterium]
MRLRRSVPLAGFLALSLVPGSFLAGAAGRVATIQDRPNILIFLTDDQRDQGSLSVMPNTRRIFEQEGVTYRNAYDSTPLCCPARGSLWSGQYSHNHGVLTNGDPAAEAAFDQTTTLQYYLTQAGYMNALVGKYWNTWPRTTPPPYFQRFTMMSGGYEDAWFNVDGVQERLPGYSTDVMGDAAVTYLQSFEETDEQPWFLYIATHAPHSDFTPAPTYANAPVPRWTRNASVREHDLSDKPATVRNSDKPLAVVSHVRAEQLRTLMSVDDMVQQVFDELDQLGEQDTLAFFLTDNGFFWGEHGGLNEKRMPYREGVAIPLLARWPGHLAAGTVESKMVAQIDIEPAVLEALGITATHEIDGASLFGDGERRRLFMEYTRSADAPGVPSWASDLSRKYQYTEWYNEDGTLYFREYYDLTKDPLELTNLFADGIAGNEPAIRPLTRRLTADRRCAGDTCPKPVP